MFSQEFNSLLHSEFKQSELNDIAYEREKLISHYDLYHLPRLFPRLRTKIRTHRYVSPYAPLPLPGLIISAARLAGPLGPLIIALREGLTVRGWYNFSVASSVTIATGVSALADLHTSGNNYAQATGSLQPTYTANDATLNARGTATGDGTDDMLTCTTYVTPAPGTTAVYMWLVMNNITWTNGRVILGSTSTTQSNCLLNQAGVSPQNRILNGGVSLTNGGFPGIASWGRVETQLNNTAASYLKIRATNATGAAVGNNTSANGRTMFNSGTGTPACNVSIACLLQAEGTANSRFRSFADYWVTHYFGTGLV